ncbi:MAG: TonB family protein [Acidobacteriota bacterium]|nr:TonB family protein [Acidobacteriota bacterium]
MARYWFFVFLVVAFGSSVAAQTTHVRVPSDAAATHLKSSPAPEYPPLAQAARIQGNVILQISIDPSGSVSTLRVVRGHPMLVQAAIAVVRNWKYAPFELNGQPVSAVTLVVVRFGNPANHDVEDKAEVVFQDKFWAAMDRAQTALNASNLSETEQALQNAHTLLSSAAPAPQHVSEHWQWAMSMGALDRKQKRFGDAEQQYTDALSLQKDHKDSPEAAASLSAIGVLYFESNKPELARDRLQKAVSIYQKNYKAAVTMPSAQDVYSRAIAEDSWMLAKIAVSAHQPEEAGRQCHVVLNVRKSLGDNDPKVTECERLLSPPTTTVP